MGMNGVANGNGHALAKKAVRVTVKRRMDHTVQWVDYHANAKDLLCVMLAACGWSTRAIASHLKMTEGRVEYRIGKAERERRDGELTQRSKYRSGEGSVAQAIVATITSRGSVVKQVVTKTLDKRGLYAPQPTGVMRHDPARVSKSGHRKVRQ